MAAPAKARKPPPFEVGLDDVVTITREMGRRLRKARTDYEFTQEELSEAIGLSQGQISKAETGQAELTMGDTARWAIACGVQPSDLWPKVAVMPQKRQKMKPTKGDVVHPAVKESLDSYIDRKRNELSPVQLQRLPVLARGVDPNDPAIPVDDRLWDGLAGLIYELYRDAKAN